MGVYLLKNRTGDTVNKIKIESEEEAIEYFSRIKNLSEIDLLDIYDVVLEED